MKTLLTTIIAICAFTLTCRAQWTSTPPILTTTNYVGIANGSPTTALQVGAGAAAPINNGAGTAITPQIVNTQTSGTAMIGAVVNDGTHNYRIGMFADDTNLLTGITATGSSGNPSFVIRNAGAEYLRILNNGNVGIGTIHPDQALTVNGQVHSTSVLVESSVPADYVFNADYYLRPLADVKTFVDKNHHLPEVPSAAEFKKDGQNLGEMNMLLLKKVEELTLYMIEQNKKTAELTEKVKAQQEEIEQLKKGKN